MTHSLLIIIQMINVLYILNQNINKGMHEKFFDSLVNTDDFYDPFESPPSIRKAQIHRRAVSVGKDKDQQQSEACPCCENIIQKYPIPLCCKDEDLLFLGVGYSLFYKLTRYFALIILMIFMISGSGFYFLVTLKCQTECVFFFGIPIINLQISVEQSAKMADIINVVTAICIFLIVVYIKSNLNEQISELQNKVVSLEQYTIMLQNLPEIIEEQQLSKWIFQKFHAVPVSINFAYNVTQLEESYKKRHELIIKNNKLKIKRDQNANNAQVYDKLNEQINEVQASIQKQDRVLNHYKQQNITCDKTGTAFVTFSKPMIVKNILDNYQKSFINLFLRSILSVIKSPPLLFKNKNVIVLPAPAPRQIIWENLYFSYLRSIVFELLFFGSMLILIFIGFQFQYYFVKYAYELRQKSQDTEEFLILFEALVMSLIVVTLNSLLRLVIKFFTNLKRYYSYTSFHSSFCFYYSLMYILNTCFMIYIVHGHINNRETKNDKGIISEEDQVLLYDIHLIMVANAFSQPLFKIFDPMMWGRFFWRKYVETLRKQENPYTQAYVNKLWEGYEISNADNYQYIYRMLIITTWYAHSAPLGVIFSFLGIFLDYWIGKYLLLRIYKRPQNISKHICSFMIMSLELLPLIYICGLLQFTYKVSESSNLFNFLTQFLQYGVTTTVLLFCILGYLIFFRPKPIKISDKSYEEVEMLFPYTYQTQNPITKLKGEIKFLYGVLKRGVSEKQTKLINELYQLLTVSQHSKDSFAERKSVIYKIKRNMLKRANTLEMSQEMKQIKRYSESSEKSK